MSARARKLGPISDVIAPALLSAMSSPPPHGDPQTAGLWDSYLRTRDPAARSKLLQLYSQFVFNMAVRCLRRSPDLFSNSMDECISDGIVGLSEAIQGAKHFNPEHFRMQALLAIRRSIFREKLSREFGGRSRNERLRAVDLARQYPWCILERNPTREEIINELKTRTKYWRNYVPSIDVSARKMQSFSQDDEGRSAARLVADPAAIDPARAAIEGEMAAQPRTRNKALLLAAHGLKPLDRKILCWILDGHGPTAIRGFIAGRLCQRSVEDRCSKIKWLLASNKKLAASLGITTAVVMPARRAGHYPYFNPPTAPRATA